MNPPLIISICSDHRGYPAKCKLIPWLGSEGYRIIDQGCHSPVAVDYPEFAAAIARDLSSGRAHFGICLDGSGVGMSIAANRFKGVRAALVYDDVTARRAREHNHANALCLGCDLISEDLIHKIISIFLATPPGEGRHARRAQILEQWGEPPKHSPASDD